VLVGGGGGAKRACASRFSVVLRCRVAAVLHRPHPAAAYRWRFEPQLKMNPAASADRTAACCRTQSDISLAPAMLSAREPAAQARLLRHSEALWSTSVARPSPSLPPHSFSSPLSSAVAHPLARRASPKLRPSDPNPPAECACARLRCAALQTWAGRHCQRLRLRWPLSGGRGLGSPGRQRADLGRGSHSCARAPVGEGGRARIWAVGDAAGARRPTAGVPATESDGLGQEVARRSG
jgi:hypothetical protein